MLSKWAEVTSLNGGIDWYQSRDNKLHFVFWSVVMITMIICSIVFTFRTVEDYVNQPTTTATSAIQNATLEIPEVLVCFNGGLNVRKLRDADFTEEFIVNYVGGMRADVSNTSVSQMLDKELKEYLRKSKSNMRDFIRTFGYSCQDILILRKNSLQSMIGEKCCQDVQNLYSHTFGKCQLFRESAVQTYPGLDGGLGLDLKTPQDSFFQYYPSLAGEKTLSNSFSVSLDQKFKWITRRWILAPANMRTEIQIQTSRLLRLATSNPCDSSDNVYSSNTCFHRCYAEAWLDYCKCSLLEYLDDTPEGNNLTQLCTGTETNCNSYDQQWAQPCQRQCRHKCNEWVYDSAITYGALEPKPINQSVSYISIGYNTMSYIQIEEKDTFTTYTGLANIGGQVGLWLGVSIVTVIQGLYYIFLCICNSFSKDKIEDRIQKTSRSNSLMSLPRISGLTYPSVMHGRYM